MAAASREALLDAVDRHRDASSFDRAQIGSWTQAQIERRFLKLDPGDAADFQRLAGAHRFCRDPPMLRRRRWSLPQPRPQSALWVHGISGDLPIVVVRIDDPRDMGVVTDLLRAFEFLQARYLAFDLVILNERKASYIQDSAETASTMRSASVRARPAPPAGVRGEVYTLRSDLMLEQPGCDPAGTRPVSKSSPSAVRCGASCSVPKRLPCQPARRRCCRRARDVRPGRSRDDLALPTRRKRSNSGTASAASTPTAGNMR